MEELIFWLSLEAELDVVHKLGWIVIGKKKPRWTIAVPFFIMILVLVKVEMDGWQKNSVVEELDSGAFNNRRG